MRIDMRDRTTWPEPGPTHLLPYLNGRRIIGCIMADEEQGRMLIHPDMRYEAFNAITAEEYVGEDLNAVMQMAHRPFGMPEPFRVVGSVKIIEGVA